MPIRHGPSGAPLPGGEEGKDPMKIVMAIIKPFKLDEVRDALTAIGVARADRDRGQGLSAARRATPKSTAGTEYAVNFLPKLKIEVAVPADQVDNVIEAIIGAAKTGQIGDGKISCVDSIMPCASAPAKPTRPRFEDRTQPIYGQEQTMMIK